MLDVYLAAVYEVEMRRVNQFVKRNVELSNKLKEIEMMCNNLKMCMDVVNCLLQKDRVDTDQKGRKRIGFKE